MLLSLDFVPHLRGLFVPRVDLVHWCSWRSCSSQFNYLERICHQSKGTLLFNGDQKSTRIVFKSVSHRWRSAKRRDLDSLPMHFVDSPPSMCTGLGSDRWYKFDLCNVNRLLSWKTKANHPVSANVDIGDNSQLDILSSRY
jgi:hypothetical protein